MSRTDNKTEVCPPCGTAEALEDYLGTGAMSQEEWVKNRARPPRGFSKDLLDMRKAEELSKTKKCIHIWDALNCDECKDKGVACEAVICVLCGEVSLF